MTPSLVLSRQALYADQADFQATAETDGLVVDFILGTLPIPAIGFYYYYYQGIQTGIRSCPINASTS